MRTRVRACLVLLAAALAAAGCGGDGGGGDATPALRETADNLGTIRSGTITFRLEVDPRGDPEPFGFSLTGPFELADRAGALPRADIEYTQRANGQEETVRLVSDGEQAVTVVGGEEIPLEGAALEELREAGAQVLGGAGGDDGLGALRVDRWLVDPELSDGPDGTERIEGELDVVEVANGLIELAGSLTGTSRLEGEDAEQLRDAVESSEFELLTGEEDRLLRRLALSVEIAADVPEQLRDALGEVVGGTFSFLLELERPNEPVEVALP